MTIGRTDDPENPVSVPAFEAAKLFGTGSRTPSGPADMVPHQQAGHMLAIDTPARISTRSSCIRGAVHTCCEGDPTDDLGRRDDMAVQRGRIHLAIADRRQRLDTEEER